MHHRYLARQPEEKPPDVHVQHHNGTRVQDAFLLMVLIQTVLERVRQQELSMILILPLAGPGERGLPQL